MGKMKLGQQGWYLEHDVLYLYTFPEGYHHIIRGQGYWNSPTIKYVDVAAPFYYVEDGEWKRKNKLVQVSEQAAG